MMSRKELYDELKADGAPLDVSHVRMKRETLAAMYRERFGRDPDAGGEPKPQGASEAETDEPARIPALRFAESGWCPELAKSFSKGVRRPASLEEFRALRKYAAEAIP